MERITEYQDERWKERARQIRELDGHKCALCGATGLLHVHHLSYPPAPYHLWESRDDELVTLCPDCHKKVHESPFRPYLSEDRQICNYMDVEEYEKMGNEMEETEKEFKKEYMEAYTSGYCCCANCIHGVYCGYYMECNIRREEDRDGYETPPNEHCDKYEQDKL